MVEKGGRDERGDARIGRDDKGNKANGVTAVANGSPVRGDIGTESVYARQVLEREKKKLKGERWRDVGEVEGDKEEDRGRESPGANQTV